VKWTEVEAQWEGLKDHVRLEWAKLTEADVAAAKGRREALVAKIGERYGLERELVERRVDEFVAGL
jgi:uncharacterized protein YjbJ (UPF0337 family)